jgi:hypothetical protein
VSAKKDFQGRARQGEAQRAERDLPGMANPRLSARRRIAVAQKAAPAAYRAVLAAALEILFLRSRLRTS